MIHRLQTPFYLLCLSPLALAAKTPLVLLPIQGQGLTGQEKDVLLATLQEGMANRYKVYSGAEVDKKLCKFPQKDCDAKVCLQNIAIAFQGELVGRGIVLPSEGDYLLTLEIKNVFQDEVINRKPDPANAANCRA